ncbi:(Fe-S)-binding protein [Pelotomaculum isophthalicicum JI]|uniref:(Fe-S)-binding protein n=1 Tax=Pelotomaculum isophthalicicum JI TaxID=947010 RepID=A0A9X4GZF4_9FIRM|nr:(Fe-S)-binding protein [Pelotomaculum isophthalicicum]MDF9408692.1 (Fe-S)-binding protein [Pelotomaculum isophthalicicum JI]
MQYFCQAVFLQKKIAEYPLSGIFHGFIMWGFIVLIFSSLDMAAIVLFKAEITFLEHPWFLFLRDLFILLVSIGIIGFTFRRLFLKLFKQNWFHSSFRNYAIPILIFFIFLSELLYLSIHSILMERALPGAWLVVAFSDRLSFLGAPALLILMEISWWFHYLTIFSLLFIIPNSKHLHLVFAPFNIYWRSLRTKGSLQPASLAETSKQVRGVNTVDDFTWKQLLDTFSCVLCGRCHRECPSERSKEWLKPKRLNGFIRTYLEEEGSELLKNKPSIKMAGDLFHYDFIWSCTTCGGCNEACPVSIDHLSKIIDMRRGIVSEGKHIPPAMKEFFNNLEQSDNPYGKPRKPGHDYIWAGELGIPSISEKPDADYLFFVGCQGTFDKPTQKAAAAFAKILQSAKVDFAILGKEERCCGETARRMGNEPLFQKIAQGNISSWAKYGINKIITFCPHCFNTFKNEYPQFGGNYDIISHAAFLADLLRQGRLQITHPRNTAVNYHDACYLGRFNDIYEQPRYVLRSVPGVRLIEMPRNKKGSFCCGAGGGRFWTRSERENPISVNRVKEALATEASMVITACPYCRTIFKEKTERQEPGDIMVLDIAELLLSALSD